MIEILKNLRLLTIAITYINIAIFSMNIYAKPLKKVLVISDIPETTEINYFQNACAYLFQLEYNLSLEKIVSDQFFIDKADWFASDKKLSKIQDYDLLVLWDCPSRIIDSRKTDPFYKDLEVISDDSAKKIVEFVQKGGGLIVAGGVTCYGDDPPLCGATQNNGKREYKGYADSPIAGILPVIIPDNQTTLKLIDNQIKLESGKLDNHNLLFGLDIQQWGFNCAHLLQPKPDANILCRLSNDYPIIAVSEISKGRVVCVMASPRGNNFVTSDPKSQKSPFWKAEGIFWNRLLRWATKLKRDIKDEQMLLLKYEAILSNPEKKDLGQLQQEFPYIVHSLNQCLPDNIRNLCLKFYRQSCFNHIIIQSAPVESAGFWQKLNNELNQNNLIAIAHTDLAVEPRHQKIPAEKWAQWTLPGKAYAENYGEPSPCPYSEVVLRLASEKAEKIVKAVGNYKYIKGCVYDDEWAWTMGYRNPYQGSQGVGSYSFWANERYKSKTGEDAPDPVYREPGFIAPEDDKWLKWCIQMRQDGFYEYNDKIKNTVKNYRSDFKLCNYPGGFEGNLDIMIEEVYLDCWKESELEALERIDVRANWRNDIYRDKHDIYSLIGLFRMPEDKSIYPETLRLTAGMCLGSGSKGLILWNAANLWAPNLQIYGRQPLYKEAKEIGEFLTKYGCLFNNLKKVPADVWVLSGWFWINSFDNYYHLPGEPALKDTERPWWMFQASDIFVPALMRSGLYVEFVTEKQLMSDMLFDKKAVIIPSALYSRQAVVDNLKKYAETSGKLFVDKSCRVSLPFAEKLPTDFSKWHYDILNGKRPVATPTEENYRKHRAMCEAYVKEAIPVIREKITQKLNPNIKINNDKACYTLMQNGKTIYLFVFNADTDNPNTIAVNVGFKYDCIYDIKSSCKINTSNGCISANYKAGDWNVFALCSQQINKIAVKSCNHKEAQLCIEAEVLDKQGKIFSGAVPIEIELYNKNGKVTKLYKASSNGQLDTQINVEQMPVSIKITELFSGKSIKQKI